MKKTSEDHFDIPAILPRRAWSIAVRLLHIAQHEPSRVTTTRLEREIFGRKGKLYFWMDVEAWLCSEIGFNMEELEQRKLLLWGLFIAMTDDEINNIRQEYTR